MDPVEVVVGTDGVVVGDVATVEAVATDDALRMDADAANADSSAMEVVVVTCGETACDDCTYLLFEEEHFFRLDCSSIGSKVHRKFRPLASRWAIRERALEVAMTLTNVGCSLPAAAVPAEVELSAEAWRL